MHLENPIRTPVTDDWLYLPIGTHETSLLRIDSFELINGHQQFLVKFIVWLVGFLPGVYYSYIWFVNATLAFLGIYLIISSQIYLLEKRNSLGQILIFVLILCNFKPLYLYMSITGTGLCLTMLFFGIYYYAANKMSDRGASFIKMVCVFLAPFATGFGISLAIAYLIETIFYRRVKPTLRVHQIISMSMVPISGLAISYLLPTFFNILNPRSSEDGASKFNNIFELIRHPLRVLFFVFGLLGSTLTPSSQFDPLLPVFIGSIIFLLVSWNLLISYTFKIFMQDVLSNKTPLLGAWIFVLMLVVFRGLGEQGTLSESVAPRYVMGTSLLVLGLVIFILKRQNESLKPRLQLQALLIVLLCSVSGLKTGLEWLSVRSQQTTTLRSCLEIEIVNPVKCLGALKSIEEGESNDLSSGQDLRKLSVYLIKFT